MLDSEKIKFILEKRSLGSYANNSRWEEFFDSLESFDHTLRVRVKIISVDSASDWSRWLIPVPGCFEHTRVGPMKFNCIEWLDIETMYEKHLGHIVSPETINVQEDVKKIIIESKLTANYEEKYIRVWGYK